MCCGTDFKTVETVKTDSENLAYPPKNVPLHDQVSNALTFSPKKIELTLQLKK
jgi:hypothetical protein